MHHKNYVILTSFFTVQNIRADWESRHINDSSARLDAAEGDFPAAARVTGSFYDRLICVPNKCSITPVLQLEARPSSSDGRRPVHVLAGTLSLHVSPVRPHQPLLTQVEGREALSCVDSPSLAQPNMVPTIVEQHCGPSYSSSTHTGYPVQPRRAKPSDGEGRSPSFSRLACLRRSFQAEGLSDEVVDIIRKSWRFSTESAYSSAWKRWDSWCLERHLDPPLRDVLEFLCEQFRSGKQYRTINTIRSAISMTHSEIDGTRVGQHPLVSRFLKGVFNSRPPTPRYSATWDVDVVLTYLRGLPANPELSFQNLSHKLAMLMALSNADRCSDLVALDLRFKSEQGNGVKFVIPGLTKTRRTGPPVVAFYTAFPEDPQICPVETLKVYERRSKVFRSTADNALFLSVRKPHKPITAATIGHWLKKVMEASGIDTATFSAHSTRGASTSKAKSAGVSMADILKAANWTSSSTFCRFYCRPVNSTEFGQGVLRTLPPS